MLFFRHFDDFWRSVFDTKFKNRLIFSYTHSSSLLYFTHVRVFPLHDVDRHTYNLQKHDITQIRKQSNNITTYLDRRLNNTIIKQEQALNYFTLRGGITRI